MLGIIWKTVWHESIVDTEHENCVHFQCPPLKKFIVKIEKIKRWTRRNAEAKQWLP